MKTSCQHISLERAPRVFVVPFGPGQLQWGDFLTLPGQSSWPPLSGGLAREHTHAVSSPSSSSSLPRAEGKPVIRIAVYMGDRGYLLLFFLMKTFFLIHLLPSPLATYTRLFLFISFILWFRIFRFHIGAKLYNICVYQSDSFRLA